MAPIPEALVEPAALRWLREAAGLSLEDTARKLGAAPDKPRAWEAGSERPSMPQPRKLAKAFKRPISHFYLPRPVAEPPIPHDFRRLPDTGDKRCSPALLHEIRTTRQRRALDLAAETARESADLATRKPPCRFCRVIRDWTLARGT